MKPQINRVRELKSLRVAVLTLKLPNPKTCKL